MASQADLGISKDQLAWINERADQSKGFVGLPHYANELQKQYRVSQIRIERAGSHLKCNLVFYAFLALAAASGATWLFLTQGQGGFISAVCLTAISASFVVTLVIMAILTAHKQKSLENAYAAQAGRTVGLQAVVQAMEHPEVTIPTIRAIVERLDDGQRKEFIQAAYSYDATQKLSPGQEKIFKALMANPSLLELIAQKERAFALTLLHYADPQTLPESFFDALVLKIGAPQSSEEAAFLAQYPPTLQRYSDSLENNLKISYRFAFLKHTAADTPGDLVQRWLVEPTSTEQANILAQHSQSITSHVRQNRQFALKMLRYLPQDSHPELLRTLLISAGAPKTEKGAELCNNHPEALSRVLSEDGMFALGYIQVDNQNIGSLENVPAPKTPEELVKYAQEPKAVARLALSSPQSFDSSVVFSIFSAMPIQAKIEFLQQLGTITLHSKKVMEFILNNLLTKTFVEQYDNLPEAAIGKDFKDLLRHFGRWPDLVAKRLFEADFATENSLLKNELFVRLFFESMTDKDRQACILHATTYLGKQKDAVTECTQWLKMTKFPEWLAPVLAYSPDILAKALCSNENDRSHLKGQEIIGLMPQEQLIIYEQKLMEYFLAHYEKAVFEDKIGSPALTNRLIDRVRYLKTHPNWVEHNPKLAKRYIELTVAGTQDIDFQSELLGSYPDLFNPFAITFNDYTESFPAYRLVSLSPVLANLITSGMQSADTKTISLDDEAIDDDTVKAFMHYLKTGTLSQEDALDLALSYLAQFYQMGHLSALCTQALKAVLNKDTYKNILEAAVTYKLCDLSTLCLDFISMHSQDSDIINYSRNPPTFGPIRDFIQFGMRCSTLKIKVSYEPGKEEVLTSPQFGRYLSIPMGTHQVHLEQPLVTPGDLNQLTAFINPTALSTKYPSITRQLLLSTHQLEQTALTTLLLACAENEDWSNLIMIPNQALDLYILAHQHDKKILAATCLNLLQKYLDFPTLFTALISSQKYHLPDLKLVCLILISKRSKDPHISKLAKAAQEDLADANKLPKNECVEERRSAEEFNLIMELGIICANEEIEISYTSGEHHVTVKCYTEDNPKRSFKGNKDRVLDALAKLQKIRPINHLHAASIDIIRSETKFLGEVVMYHRYHAPLPPPEGVPH